MHSQKIASSFCSWVSSDQSLPAPEIAQRFLETEGIRWTEHAFLLHVVVSLDSLLLAWVVSPVAKSALTRQYMGLVPE